MNIAVIENGIVENIIICESVEIASELTQKECVEYTDDNPAFIGGTFDGSIFTAPESEELPILVDTNGNS